VGEEKRTLEDVAGQVALVFAAAGSGGGTVWVGVLPLLEEFLGLVEQDLVREEESQRIVFQRDICVVVVALRWSSRGGRMLV
jgi:hypothetical protein